jgi:hypothetical protein
VRCFNSTTFGVLLMAWFGVTAAGCAPHVAPASVPPVERKELQGFESAVKAYLDSTQPYRKNAAAQASSLPNQAKAAPESETAVRLRERTMADAIKKTVRPAAQRGEIFVPDAAALIRRDIGAAFSGPKGGLIRDELADQNEGEGDAGQTPRVNETLKAPRVPPLLGSILPKLPQQLEYDFTRRALLLRDVDANIIVDFIPDALPERPGQPAPPPPSSRAPATTEPPLLAVPDIRGATVFGIIGDSGSGDKAQYRVAAAMTRYFDEARRFRFVLMLGDNLYHDDYTNEFAVPYKDLIDRGITFHAAIGNHDRDLQQHFKPFNMGDRTYYAFTKGHARFVALNSNRPADDEQLKWLDGAFTDAGDKWRIAFFHHPLYSSGEHAMQSREAIRPSLEPALVRNNVNVVFSGHEHLYERIAPQKNVRYFVSGGAGRTLYAVNKSPFDDVAVSAHHFMVIALTPELMFFQAITPDGKILDCGTIWRTPAAEAKGLDDKGQAWQRACQQSIAKPATTQH